MADCCGFLWGAVGISILAWILRELPTILQLITSLIKNEQIDLKQRYGDWAVITGSSDGIGKAYAHQLAARGINIVLIGRNREKLEAVAKELHDAHKIQTKIVIADFSQGRPIYENIRKELENVDVGILVNNVGIQYKYPMAFSKLPEDEIWDNVNINVTSATMMTSIIIPQMVEKNKGCIVNLSSAASQQPQPYMNLYAASKAYVTYFSEGLREELKMKGSNITVQTLTPFYISSKINHFEDSLREVSLFKPDVDTYAAHAVNSLGKIDFTTGYWPHRLQWFFFSILPPIWLRTKVLGPTYRKYGSDYLKRISKE